MFAGDGHPENAINADGSHRTVVVLAGLQPEANENAA